MKTTANRGIVTVVSRIREAANLMISSELAARGITGVVPAHGVLFAFLFQQSAPVPIMALVKKTGRSKSTITEMVKTLQKHGYLRRQASAADGRSVEIELTAKGWAVRAEFEEISVLLEERIYRGISPQNQTVLLQMLGTVLQNLS